MKYCNLCQRNVPTRRHIGIGTLILVLLTMGFWLPVILFYRQRCTICHGDALVPTKAIVPPKQNENQTNGDC